MSAISVSTSLNSGGIKTSGGTPATGPVLASAPSVQPSVAQQDETLTRTQGLYLPRGGGNVSLSLSEWRIGAVTVATGPDYTPTPADVGAVLSYVEQATETGGTADGATTLAVVTLGTVQSAQEAAPTSNGALSDQVFDTDSGVHIYDVSGDFTGQNLLFSLQSAQAGVSITTAGVLSVDTGVTGPLSETTIVVLATNSGGAASSGFTLSVTSVDTTAPVIEAFSVAQSAQDAPIDITVAFTETESLPITCYIVGVPDGADVPSASQIMAGQASDGSTADIVTSFTTSASGTNSASVSDIATGLYDLHAVAADSAGNLSNLSSAFAVTMSYTPTRHVFVDDFTGHPPGTLLRETALYSEQSNAGARTLEAQSGTLVHNDADIEAVNLFMTYDGYTFTSDHYFEATFANVPDQTSQAYLPVIGFQDAENYYAARIRFDSLEIRRKLTSASEEVLIGKPFSISDNAVVRLEKLGDQITLSVNGTPELSIADTTFSGGRCGYRVYISSAVDDPATFDQWEFGEP